MFEKFANALLKKEATIESSLLESIKTKGISETFNTLTSARKINLTKDFLESYIQESCSFLKKEYGSKDLIKFDTVSNDDDDKRIPNVAEICNFIKTLLPNSNNTFFSESSLRQNLTNKQAQPIIDLLTNNRIEITELESILENKEFLRFLQLNDKFFKKYLTELSRSEKKLLSRDDALFNAIISKANLLPEEKFKEIMPKIMDAITKAHIEKVETKTLNDFFVKHLQVIKNDNYKTNPEKLLNFINKIQDDNILNSLELRCLKQLMNLIEELPSENNNSTEIDKIRNKFIAKQLQEEQSKKKSITLTTASAKLFDKQKSEATTEQDNNLEEIIKSTVDELNQQDRKATYKFEKIVEEGTKKKGKPTSFPSFKIKYEETDEVVATFEQTANGSTIKIPEHNTDILVKILEGLANDPNTKDISVGGLSKANIESITENLDKKIKALTPKDKEKYKPILQKLINKLGAEDANKELVTALKGIQEKQHGLANITVASRLSTVENGPFSPDSASPANPIEHPSSAPATIPNTPPNSAPPRRRYSI